MQIKYKFILLKIYVKVPFFGAMRAVKQADTHFMNFALTGNYTESGARYRSSPHAGLVEAPSLFCASSARRPQQRQPFDRLGVGGMGEVARQVQAMAHKFDPCPCVAKRQHYLPAGMEERKP